MPLYFFHLHDGVETTFDVEGIERPTLESAISAAVAGARDLMSHAVKDGKLDMASRIHVANDTHQVVYTLEFADAVKISGYDRHAAG